MQNLTKEERERVADSAHNIQAATASLSQVDPQKIPKVEEIEECLESADKTLRGVLASQPVKSRDGA